MKRFTAVLFAFFLAASAAMGEMRSSITQFGVTWTFDQPYECGQFVNGDWYVVGPATVQSVSPAPETGRHNSMINPVTGTQAYDDRVAAYQDSLAITYPVTLTADQSLVSSISMDSSDCNCTLTGGDPGFKDLSGACIPYKAGRPMLKTAAVLTCVGSAPAEMVFRPGFCGAVKKYIPYSAMQTGILPALAPVDDVPDMSGLLRGVERPWLSHIGDWTSRSLHPRENMRDYHAKIFDYYKEAYLMTLLEVPGRDSLVMRLVQHGIDMNAMVLLGHGGSGTAKWPVLFAGLMLDDADMKDMYADSTSLTPFREDWMTYYGSDATSPRVSSIVPAGMCWTGYVIPSGPRAGESVMWRQDPGDAEHEHMHPSEWADIPPSGGGCKHESYRLINSVNWPGMALNAMLMGGRELWHHPAFFDYCDRWMNEDMTEPMNVMDSICAHSGYQSAGSAFANQMWAAYRGLADSVAGIHPDAVVRGVERNAVEVFPNPMQSVTRFSVPAGADEIRIYNAVGRMVHVINYPHPAEANNNSSIRGGRETVWNGTDMAGNAVLPGIYNYVVKSGVETYIGRIFKIE